MGEVTAYAAAGQVDVRGSGQRRRAAVLERQVIVNVVTNGLDPAVTRRQAAESGPRLVGQNIGQAVSAWHGVDQRVVRDVVGQPLRRVLICVLGGIRDLGHRLVAEAGPACRKHRPDAGIAVEVGVVPDRHLRLGQPPLVLNRDLGRSDRPDMEDSGRVDLGLVDKLAADLDPACLHWTIILAGCFGAVKPPARSGHYVSPRASAATVGR